jgi:hypothetical protein
MRKFLTLLALTCALAAPAVACAEPSAKALALTKRMVAAMHMQETMVPMLRNMMAQQADAIAVNQKSLNDKQKAMLRDAVRESMEDVFDGGFMQQLMDKLTPAYAEVYSEEELQAMVDFYESPIGQSILRKMPQLGTIASKSVAELLPKMQAEMVAKMSKRMEAIKAAGN